MAEAIEAMARNRLAGLIDEAYRDALEATRRYDELMLRALRGGPFWGVGKAPAKPGDVRGLAEFLPRSRRG